jgi:UDP-N-acetylglucosamine 1-carboxyvinyltransferase
VIEGGRRPRGHIRVSGAKNSATRLLAAALLASSPTTLVNFPTRLVDVDHNLRFIEGLGVDVSLDHDAQALTVSPARLGVSDFDRSDDFPIRTTYLLAAGQILRNGRARVPYPGGCSIGPRGFDQHVMVWESLGCSVEQTPEALEITSDGFVGGKIEFPITTVGGTENALMCASVARGVTEIQNAYITPEVEDLIDLLRRMGSNIAVFGGSRIRVEGVEGLDGVRMPVMSDRVEALTWIVYAVMAGGELRIESVPFASMEIPFIHLEKAGIDLFRSSSGVYVHPDCLRGGTVQPFELACGTHPGIISDMQPFFVLLGLMAEGTSRVFDYRYPERTEYVAELARFCQEGSIEAHPGSITVRGGGPFRPAHACSTDLRGSMSLVMAALCAPGMSRVDRVELALRGYNDLEAKLTSIGVPIEIVDG